MVLGARLMIDVGDVLILAIAGGDRNRVVYAGAALLRRRNHELAAGKLHIQQGKRGGIDVGALGGDGGSPPRPPPRPQKPAPRKPGGGPPESAANQRYACRGG